LGKKRQFPQTSVWRMKADALEMFIRQYIESQPSDVPTVTFAWQGGEPTLLGVDFFRQAVELQRRFARAGLGIENALQTNGTLLDEEWGRFLAVNHFLVGLSVDGPRELHDRYRLDNRGRPTFDAVMRGLEVLKKHRVEFNTLTVLHEANAQHPDEMYDFLTDAGSKFLQFIPLVMKDENDAVHPYSVRPADYGSFLNRTIDLWLKREHVGKVFVQDFDVTLSSVMGFPSPLCTRAETCGCAVVVEHNGDIYSCDHYVFPENLIGAVQDDAMATSLDGDRQTRFGADKRDALPRYCRECSYRRLCNGGCPKDRIAIAPHGESGLNYLCEGFKMFFAHSLPVFEKMGRCLNAGGTADQWQNVEAVEERRRWDMQADFRSQLALRGRAQRAQIGRNAPCPCGSGLKHKKCCGR